MSTCQVKVGNTKQGSLMIRSKNPIFYEVLLDVDYMLGTWYIGWTKRNENQVTQSLMGLK